MPSWKQIGTNPRLTLPLAILARQLFHRGFVKGWNKLWQHAFKTCLAMHLLYKSRSYSNLEREAKVSPILSKEEKNCGHIGCGEACITNMQESQQMSRPPVFGCWGGNCDNRLTLDKKYKVAIKVVSWAILSLVSVKIHSYSIKC